MSRTQRTYGPIALGIAVGAVAAIALGAPPALAVDPADLEARVTVDAAVAHLQALQDIAEANDGNRAVGTSGYEASGQYVEDVLRAAGYDPVRQDFEAATQTIDEYALSIDGFGFEEPFGIPMEFTPSTPAEGLTGVPLVAPAQALGCDADAWTGVDATGHIALVSRGECAFGDKATVAAAAGAVAILVYNSEAGPLNGTFGGSADGRVPGVGIEQEQGRALLAALAEGPVTADLQLQETVTVVDTFNIIADTPTGDPDNTVMLGAHLDSVPEGPGINDNGSGAAAILETAVQLAASEDPVNRVRFAWWGAEEVGLLGSTEYVASLSEEEGAQIVTYLNFDMVASPNYVISVYDADQSTHEAPVDVPEGSIQTEAAFTSYFDEIGQPWTDTAFDGRSDYQAFILAGIPASGLFTGADDVKTAEEAALFGGTVGEQHDPNYHTPADDMSNIDEEAFGIMLGAIAHVTAELATDVSPITGEVPPQPEPEPEPTLTALPIPSGDDAPILAESGSEPFFGGALAAALLMGVGAIALAVTRRRSASSSR